MQDMAKKGFASKKSQWNSYWHGKVASGLKIALSIKSSVSVRPDDTKGLGVGRLFDMDTSKMRVVIAACIDGGPVAQEEQRIHKFIVDEVIFDLLKRGIDMATDAAIFITSFPGVKSLVESLNGTRNLRLAHACFATRQHDECVGLVDFSHWVLHGKLKAFQLTAERTDSLLKASCGHALKVQDFTNSGVRLGSAKPGGKVGVKRLIEAKCTVEQAKSEDQYSTLHACAQGGPSDITRCWRESCKHFWVDCSESGRKYWPRTTCSMVATNRDKGSLFAVLLPTFR